MENNISYSYSCNVITDNGIFPLTNTSVQYILYTEETINFGNSELVFRNGILWGFKNRYSADLGVDDERKKFDIMIQLLCQSSWTLLSIKFNVVDLFLVIQKDFKSFKTYIDSYVNLYTLKSCAL
jgi:hypothetical protein